MDQLLSSGSLIVLFLIFIFFAKLVNDWLTPYSLDKELTQKDNTALALSLAGYLLAGTIIFIGTEIGISQGFLNDILMITGYYILGIVLLNISRIINDKAILYKFCNLKELTQERNIGVGAVQFGSYLASGLIIAGAISGEGGGILTAIVFYILGQLALVLFTKLYNFITPFDIHQELKTGNVAAGVAFSGGLVSLGIILMKGVSGNFISWQENMLRFLFSLILVFILLPVVRIFFDKVIIPRSNLNDEIKNDKNLGVAFLEAVIMISFSSVLIFMI
ncbi:MAG: DUF350 domain-containing protein [bacterium]|nr:DUF350 domain-containing protein [bacterium]